VTPSGEAVSVKDFALGVDLDATCEALARGPVVLRRFEGTFERGGERLTVQYGDSYVIQESVRWQDREWRSACGSGCPRAGSCIEVVRWGSEESYSSAVT
jgi:hypothetical protein